jgi:UDPglucose 6-dehydrogenase
LTNADALVICTEWKTFRTVEPAMFRKHLRERIVVDGRNLFDPITMASAGIDYHAFGRLRSFRN